MPYGNKDLVINLCLFFEKLGRHFSAVHQTVDLIDEEIEKIEDQLVACRQQVDQLKQLVSSHRPAIIAAVKKSIRQYIYECNDYKVLLSPLFDGDLNDHQLARRQIADILLSKITFRDKLCDVNHLLQSLTRISDDPSVYDTDLFCDSLCSLDMFFDVDMNEQQKKALQDLLWLKRGYLKGAGSKKNLKLFFVEQLLSNWNQHISATCIYDHLVSRILYHPLDIPNYKAGQEHCVDYAVPEDVKKVVISEEDTVASLIEKVEKLQARVEVLNKEKQQKEAVKKDKLLIESAITKYLQHQVDRAKERYQKATGDNVNFCFFSCHGLKGIENASGLLSSLKESESFDDVRSLLIAYLNQSPAMRDHSFSSYLLRTLFDSNNGFFTQLFDLLKKNDDECGVGEIIQGYVSGQHVFHQQGAVVDTKTPSGFSYYWNRRPRAMKQQAADCVEILSAYQLILTV
jgi:hypothetical protein